MKLLIIFSVVFSFVGFSFSSKLSEIKGNELSSNFPQNAVEDFIKDLINNILADLPDPALIEPLSMNINDPGLKLELNLTELSLNGLKSINVTGVKATIISLIPLKGNFNVTINVASLNIKGDYITKGLLGFLFPIHGNGDLSLALSNIDLVLGGILVTKLLPPTFSITDLHYTVNFGDFEVKLGGFLGGGEAGQSIIDLINNFGLQILVAGEALLHEEIVRILEEALKDIPIG